MSDTEDDRDADIADDNIDLVITRRKRKRTSYDGHCACCDKGRSSGGLRRGRRQGYNVPVDVVVPSRPCDADCKHDRICRTCWLLWYQGCLPAPTTRIHRTETRDGADDDPESAASALLLNLSSRAPMDLDLALRTEPLLVDTTIVSSAIDVQIMDMMIDTPPSTPVKKKQRLTTAAELLQKSGGTQRVAVNALLGQYKEIVDGQEILNIPNERGPKKKYVRQCKVRVGNERACKRTLSNRINALEAHRTTLSHVSAVDDHVNNKSEMFLITKEINRTPNKFELAVNNQSTPLSPHETAQFMSVTNMTDNQFRTVKSFLSNKKKSNIFASATAVKEQIKGIVHNYQTGHGATADSAKIPYIHYTDVAAKLNDLVKPIMENYSTNFKHDILPNRTIQLAVYGDKGGNSTKLGVTLINSEKPQSPFSIQPMAMYESDEDYELIKEFFSKTISDIEEWAAAFPTNNNRWKVKLLNGGDTHWLWNIMGLAKKGKNYCPFCECDINNGIHTVAELGENKLFMRKHLDHLTNCDDFNQKNPELNNFRGIQKKASDFKNCIRIPLIGKELYENPIPPLLHIDMGICKIVIELCEDLSIKKDLEARICNYNNKESKEAEVETLRNAIQQFITSSEEIKEFEEEIVDLAKQKERALRGQKGPVQANIKITKQKLKKSKTANAASREVISEFEGDHTKTYNNLKNSILVHRKHNVGLRGALVGSVANKMFAPEFIKELSVALTLAVL